MSVVLVGHDQVEVHIVQLDSGEGSHFFITPPYCLPSERVHKTPVVLVGHDQVQVHIVQLDSGEGSHPPRVHRHESNHILGHLLGKQAPAICTHGM